MADGTLSYADMVALFGGDLTVPRRALDVANASGLRREDFLRAVLHAIAERHLRVQRRGDRLVYDTSGVHGAVAAREATD